MDHGAAVGDQGRLQDLFLKVGSDSENFYLYRTDLTPPGNPAGVTPAAVGSASPSVGPGPQQ